jgi:hypothetical protein
VQPAAFQLLLGFLQVADQPVVVAHAFIAEMLRGIPIAVCHGLPHEFHGDDLVDVDEDLLLGERQDRTQKDHGKSGKAGCHVRAARGRQRSGKWVWHRKPCAPFSPTEACSATDTFYSPTITRCPWLCEENSGAYMHMAVVMPLLKSPACVTRRVYSNTCVPAGMRSKKKFMLASRMLW